jgi:hypothetical protein
MAKDKKSFILYCDLIHEIDHLTDEEKGKLFQHLLEYVNDMNPTLDDRVLLGSWKHIQRQLKRDLMKYEERREQNRANALKRWNAVASDCMEEDAKDAVNGTDTVNDTDTDTVNGTEKEDKYPFSLFWNAYDKKNDKASCETKWGKLKDSQKELIMQHVPKYVKNTPDKKYRKNPLTYLNKKTWLDGTQKDVETFPEGYDKDHRPEDGYWGKDWLGNKIWVKRIPL